MRKITVPGRLLIRLGAKEEPRSEFAKQVIGPKLRYCIEPDLELPREIQICETTHASMMHFTCSADYHGNQLWFSKPMNAVTITPEQAEHIAKEAESGTSHGSV